MNFNFQSCWGSEEESEDRWLSQVGMVTVHLITDITGSVTGGDCHTHRPRQAALDGAPVPLQNLPEVRSKVRKQGWWQESSIRHPDVYCREDELSDLDVTVTTRPQQSDPVQMPGTACKLYFKCQLLPVETSQGLNWALHCIAYIEQVE